MNFTDIPDDSEESEQTLRARAAAASRSTWVSVAVNLVLSALQISIGFISGSQGLVADGVHSLSDLFSDFVVLFASHHSKKDADEKHPYGHHRFETAASMVLGVFLVTDTTTCFPLFKGKDKFLRVLQLANKISNPNK